MGKKPSDIDLLRQRLRKLREDAGYTQENVAEFAGIAPIYYQSIEAGRRKNPTLDTLSEVAAIYGLTVQEIFAAKPPKPKVKRPVYPSPHKTQSKRGK